MDKPFAEQIKESVNTQIEWAIQEGNDFAAFVVIDKGEGDRAGVLSSHGVSPADMMITLAISIVEEYADRVKEKISDKEKVRLAALSLKEARLSLKKMNVS